SIASVPAQLRSLSLHDALPISARWDRHDDPGPLPPRRRGWRLLPAQRISFPDYLPNDAEKISAHDPLNARFAIAALEQRRCERQDRKSTRLNSSHQIISYAVSC